MRILIVTHAFHVGGAEAITARYARKQKELGHEVLVMEFVRIESHLRRSLTAAGVEIVTVNPISRRNKLLFKLYNLILLRARQRRIIKRFRPDVIHYHTWNRRIPYDNTSAIKLHTYHGDIDVAFKRDHKANLKLLRYGYDIVLFSEKMRCDALKAGFEERRIHKIYNGLDLKQIAATGYSRDKARQELGIREGEFVVGHIGRFNPVKRQKFIVEIFASVLERKPESRLVMIGDGPDDYYGEVMEYARENGLADKIVTTGQRADATSLLPAMDAFVLPSKHESFSLALVEAQVFGLRCVASDGVPEEVARNSNVFRLPMNSPAEEWADKLLADDEHPERGSIYDFDIDKVMKEHEDLYQSLLSKRK